MTVDELIDSVVFRYNVPASTATIVSFFNEAQRELSPYFDVECTLEATVTADVDEYALPTGCEDISRILELGMSKNGAPTDRYDYDRYSKATRDDYPKNGKGYYQITNSEGVKTLVVYPVPTLSTTVMSIHYKRPLADLSSSTLTGVPEFDSRYHMGLVYYAIRELAVMGDTPDTLQADYYTQRWNSMLEEIYRAKMRDEVRHPRRRRDNRQWHGAKQYVGLEEPEGGGEV